MATKHKGKGVVRSVKNFTKGYSDIEIKVRDATSNDPYGPSSRLMAEISAASNNQYMFMEIMNMLDKRLNDKGKNWRHVYKALVVVDYLLHSGSEHVMSYIVKNMFIIKTLQQFQYVDEQGKDQGATVRSMAKDIIYLIDTPEKLEEERRDGSHLRYQSPLGLDNASEYSGMRNRSYSADDLSAKESSRMPRNRHSLSTDQEDRDFQRAIEESKRLALTEQDKMKQSEEELKLAIELSKAAAADNVHSNLRATQSDTTFSTSQRERKPIDDLMDLFEGPPATSQQQQQQQQQQQIDYDNFYQANADPNQLASYPQYYGAPHSGQGSGDLFGNMSDSYTSSGSQLGYYPSYNGSNVSVTNAASATGNLLSMGQSYSQPNVYAQTGPLSSFSSAPSMRTPSLGPVATANKPPTSHGGWSTNVTDQSTANRRPGDRDPFADLNKAVPQLTSSTPHLSNPYSQNVPIGALASQELSASSRREPGNYLSAQSRNSSMNSATNSNYPFEDALLSFDASPPSSSIPASRQPYQGRPMATSSNQPYQASSSSLAPTNYLASGAMVPSGYSQSMSNPPPTQSMVPGQPLYLQGPPQGTALMNLPNPYPMRPPYPNQSLPPPSQSQPQPPSSSYGNHQSDAFF